jgi:hypothetical protein
MPSYFLQTRIMACGESLIFFIDLVFQVPVLRFSSVGWGPGCAGVPGVCPSQTVFGSHGVQPAQTLLFGAGRGALSNTTSQPAASMFRQPSPAQQALSCPDTDTTGRRDGMDGLGILHLGFCDSCYRWWCESASPPPSTMWLPRVSAASQASGRRASVVSKSNALMRGRYRR